MAIARRFAAALPGAAPSPGFVLLGLVLLAGPSLLFAQGYGGTVADMLTRGDAYLAQGRANEAVVQFQEARTLCPTPAEMVQSLQGEARALVALGRLLPAAALFEEAAQKYPEDPRGADLLVAAGQVSQRAGEVDRAIRLYRAALGRSPTIDLQPALKYQLAAVLRLRDEHQEALDLLKDFDTAYPDHPVLPNALYTRAIINHDIKRLRESEEQYRDLIARFPRTQAAVEAHFELAAVLADRGRDREAAGFYRTYVTLAPGSPVAAAALERAGDLLLLRAPGESAQLYGLAQVKAQANPKHPLPELGLGRYIGVKKNVAAALSRVWVVALLILAVAGGLGWAVYGALRRRRRERAAAAGRGAPAGTGA
jgi:tetratricopeptide (TPR) repeat protein